MAGGGPGGLRTDDPHSLADRLPGSLGLRLVLVSIVHVASRPAEDHPGRHPQISRSSCSLWASSLSIAATIS